MASIIREALRLIPARRSQRSAPFVAIQILTSTCSILTSLAPHVAADNWDSPHPLTVRELLLLGGICGPTLHWALLLSVDLGASFLTSTRLQDVLEHMIQLRRLKLCNIIEAMDADDEKQVSLLKSIRVISHDLTHLHLQSARGFYSPMIEHVFPIADRSLWRLVELTIHCPGFTDCTAHELLQQLPRLQRVDFSQTWVSDAVLKYFVSPLVESIALKNIRSFDPDLALPRLLSMPYLSKLSFGPLSRRVSFYDGMQALKKLADEDGMRIMARLTHLDVASCSLVGDEMLDIWTQLAPNLEEVHLRMCTRILRAPSFLARLNNLRLVDISGTGVGDLHPMTHADSSKGLGCPSLTSLDFSLSTLDDEDSLDQLYRLSELRELNLLGCGFSCADSVKVFADIAMLGNSLRLLDLTRTHYDPASLISMLSQMRNLEVLRLASFQVVSAKLGTVNERPKKAELLSDAFVEQLSRMQIANTLSELDLSWQTELGDNSIRLLGSGVEFPRLSTLLLRGLSLVTTAACALLRSPVMKALDLRDTPKKCITTDCFDAILTQCTLLGDIDLPVNCKVDIAARRRLAEEHPEVEIRWH